MKKFKAESQKLLEMMINSVYTHKEIFLRELISNAADAIDKQYYASLSGGNSGMSRSDYVINIDVDKTARTLTISDNGCGMNGDEMDVNLGTIAHSGTNEFRQANSGEQMDVIGQFGVGFYSAFMIAKKVDVISRPYGGEKAFLWSSDVVNGYTISETQKDKFGTDVILYLKDNTEEEQYNEFLDVNRLKSLIKKHSDYIRYPINMDVEVYKMQEKPQKHTCDETCECEHNHDDETCECEHNHDDETCECEHNHDDETDNNTNRTIERQVINSMIPIWKKPKSELTEEMTNEFYSDKYHDYDHPLEVMSVSAEGSVSFNAMLFIPSHAPYDYYTKDYEKGLQLYSNGVLIMDKCADLLPDYFSFVKGVVDSQDLSLNISREMLQCNKQLKIIASAIEKKIKSSLLDMLLNRREDYNKFYSAFGIQLKYGIYSSFGANKDLLSDLLMFKDIAKNEYTSLKEYVSNMQQGQKYIYYACGKSVESVKNIPQIEAIIEKEYNTIVLMDDVDEFVIKIIDKYEDKEFKSVQHENLDKENEEKTLSDLEKNMVEFMKKTLKGKVKDIIISQRLKSHPVCLTTQGELSIDMERVLKTMTNSNEFSAQKIMEINANHPIYSKLLSAFESDKETLESITNVLFMQSCLIEGIPLENPSKYSELVCSLLSK
ncbi:MAG: molecular chaperone HtpG [Clostridia bacterium]